jgi:transposase
MHADENAAINIGRKWMAWKLGLKNMWEVKTDVA